jgi:uncharacterized membrane protein YoaK (UPF0700 family)
MPRAPAVTLTLCRPSVPEVRSNRLSVDDARAVQALLIVLSVTAGATDIIGFLGLNGLFTAHVTGNLVLLAAHVVAGGKAAVASMLSVPVFMVTLCLTALLAGGLESIGRASLRPLLLLQLLLLGGFLALGVAAGASIAHEATTAILAGMSGVAAMAVQNALVQISLKGAPSTAVMTSNVTRFAVDVGRVLLGGDATAVGDARRRALRVLPVIVGFAAGCGLGAACEASFGLRALALPVGLALLAFAIGFAVPDRTGRRFVRTVARTDIPWIPSLRSARLRRDPSRPQPLKGRCSSCQPPRMPTPARNRPE